MKQLVPILSVALILSACADSGPDDGLALSSAHLTEVQKGGETATPTVVDVPVSGRDQATEPALANKGGDFGSCSTCVFVIERIKKGTNLKQGVASLLPPSCSKVLASKRLAGSKLAKRCAKAAAVAKQVQAQLVTADGELGLFEGCYKYEAYQAKEWVKPCPSHVMCSKVTSLEGGPFCKPLPMADPFKNDTGK